MWFILSELYNKLETSFNTAGNKAGENKGERKGEEELLRGRREDSENVNGKRHLGETNFYQFFQASTPI